MGFGSAWRDIYRACHNIGATVGSQYAKIYGGIGSPTKQQTADITAHDAAFARTKDDGGTWTRGDDVCGVCDAWNRAVCVCVF